MLGLDPISLLFIGTSGAVVAGVIGFVAIKVAPISDYLYANARVSARTSYFVPEQRFLALSQSKSLTELINNLRETDYYSTIENAKSLGKIHEAVEETFFGQLRDLISFSPKEFGKILNAYTTFYEAKIIKTFFRQKRTNVKLDDKLLFTVGVIDSVILSRLKESKTIADMQIILNNTIYANLFKEKYESLEDFETALDNLIFENFVNVVNKTKIYDASFVVDIINYKLDVSNILVLLKAMIRKVPKERKLSLLVENNTALFHKAHELVKAKNIEELVEETKGTNYYNTMKLALGEYKKNNSLYEFEKELLKSFKEFVKRSELQHVQGPYPLISFLVKKEIESRNLMVISKGIDARFSSKEIMEMVI